MTPCTEASWPGECLGRACLTVLHSVLVLSRAAVTRFYKLGVYVKFLPVVQL